MSEEVDLWVAVIEQSLWDATLGVSQKTKSGRSAARPYTLPNGNNEYGLREMNEGRAFIKGETPMLAEICQLLDMDYEDTQGMLLGRYYSCMKIIPEIYRDHP